MPHLFRRSVLAVAPLAVLAACAGGGGATGNIDHIQVAMSRFEISVNNVAGHAITGVVAEIEPVGPGSHFIAHLDTLNSTEIRALDHSKFRDRDSVPFSPRNKKAKRVIITGADLDGKPLRVEAPFTM